jgi:hypothetical protein
MRFRRWMLLLLMLCPLFLIVPRSGATIEHCSWSCQDIEHWVAECGPCDPLLITTCGIGCTCSFCTTGAGVCMCDKNNMDYPYDSHNIAPKPGQCTDGKCGDARVHVRLSAQRNTQPAGGSRAPDLANGSVLTEDLPASPLPEEVMFVPGRCTHTYGILIPRTSSVKAAGGL